MNEKGFISVLVSCVVLGVLFVVLSLTYFNDEPRKTVRITAKSNLNTLQAVFDTHFQVPEGKPEIVWRDKSGQTYGEAFIFQSLGVQKAQYSRVRKELEAEGYERVYEECRGISRPDKSWSFGYCTYREAPVLPAS